MPVIIQKITSYFKNSVEELRKVSWPTRNDLIKHTIGVIAVSVAVAAFIGVIDYLFNLGLKWLLR